jgi:hypothetical protein
MLNYPNTTIAISVMTVELIELYAARVVSFCSLLQSVTHDFLVRFFLRR